MIVQISNNEGIQLTRGITYQPLVEASLTDYHKVTSIESSKERLYRDSVETDTKPELVYMVYTSPVERFKNFWDVIYSTTNHSKNNPAATIEEVGLFVLDNPHYHEWVQPQNIWYRHYVDFFIDIADLSAFLAARNITYDAYVPSATVVAPAAEALLNSAYLADTLLRSAIGIVA